MSELPLYQIVDYDRYFENYKSRTIDQCGFVCVPNKHGGRGLTNLLSEPDGRAVFGTWQLILEYCSRQRKPREGYLTADGKKEGDPVCAAEFARMFRCSAAEIKRSLQVLSAPEVRWLKLVTGQAETPDWRQNGADTAVSPEGYQKDTAVSPEGYHSILTQDDERRNEGKNTLSKKVGLEDTAVSPEGYQKDTKDTAVPPEGYQKDTAVSAEGYQKDTVQHAEAKRVFGKLSEDVFGEPLRETQWPNDMDHWLDKALPMRRENLELIDWFYRLPADHEIFNVTRRRQTLRAVIENLSSEPQKIRSARKTIGLNGLHDDEPKTARSDSGWTAKRKQAAYEEFGEGVSFATPFDKLPVEYQDRIDARIGKVTA